MYLNLERNFLREHIMEWVPGFCERVADMAEFDFYRGIARMTKGFVVDDYETIVSLIALMGR
jgi:TorA maturation chaperone TorD